MLPGLMKADGGAQGRVNGQWKEVSDGGRER